MQNLVIPLKKEERDRLKTKDGLVMKVFTNPLTLKPLYVFLAMRKLTKKDLKVPLEEGCDVAPIDIDEDSINKIESHKEGMRAGYGGFNIFVVSEEMHKEVSGNSSHK